MVPSLRQDRRSSSLRLYGERPTRLPATGNRGTSASSRPARAAGEPLPGVGDDQVLLEFGDRGYLSQPAAVAALIKQAAPEVVAR
jgi:hypothetical protein